jgi:hypothetical protein
MDGCIEGWLEGWRDGHDVGCLEGLPDGCTDGWTDGRVVGWLLGLKVGVKVGARVGPVYSAIFLIWLFCESATNNAPSSGDTAMPVGLQKSERVLTLFCSPRTEPATSSTLAVVQELARGMARMRLLPLSAMYRTPPLSTAIFIG